MLRTTVLAWMLAVGVSGCAGSDPRQGCTESGGSVSTQQCCGAPASFPNTCASSVCSCTPQSGAAIEVCNCPDGRCFDGSRCVAVQACRSASDCTGALPALCQLCSDGSTGCAHFACVAGACVVQTCP